jgi:lysylphosphatidylglycerol synthetase-like protein (DUF2156 family)
MSKHFYSFVLVVILRINHFPIICRSFCINYIMSLNWNMAFLDQYMSTVLYVSRNQWSMRVDVITWDKVIVLLWLILLLFFYSFFTDWMISSLLTNDNDYPFLFLFFFSSDNGIMIKLFSLFSFLLLFIRLVIYAVFIHLLEQTPTTSSPSFKWIFKILIQFN